MNAYTSAVSLASVARALSRDLRRCNVCGTYQTRERADVEWLHLKGNKHHRRGRWICADCLYYDEQTADDLGYDPTESMYSPIIWRDAPFVPLSEYESAKEQFLQTQERAAFRARYLNSRTDRLTEPILDLEDE